MTDWWAASIQVQQHVPCAQHAAVEAGQGATEVQCRALDAGRRTADATRAVWNAWAKPWDAR